MFRKPFRVKSDTAVKGSLRFVVWCGLIDLRIWGQGVRPVGSRTFANQLLLFYKAPVNECGQVFSGPPHVLSGK